MKTFTHKSLSLALALAALALNLPVVHEAQAASWANTGSLTTAHGFHTATLLPNGETRPPAGIALEATTASRAGWLLGTVIRSSRLPRPSLSHPQQQPTIVFAENGATMLCHQISHYQV